MKELKNLKKSVQAIRLSDQERQKGREQFLAFMKANPMSRDLYEPVAEGFLARFYSLLRHPLRASATVLGVLIVTASGISYAAESTIPGDLLYPIKVTVNEQIQGFFYFDTKSKAEWELDRMERRFEEVEDLSHEGDLNMETKSTVQQELKGNTEAVIEHVKDLKEDGKAEEAAEIESNFQDLMDVHQDAALDVDLKIEDIIIDVTIEDIDKPEDLKEIEEVDSKVELPIESDDSIKEDSTVKDLMIIDLLEEVD